MKHKPESLLLVLFLGALTGIPFGCQSGPTQSNPSDTLENRLLLSPREDAEAEALALLYSGDLVAPEALYQTITKGLVTLRKSIPDSLKNLRDIHYNPRVAISAIQPLMTSEAKDLIRKGEYTEWDSLNAVFGTTVTDTLAITIYDSKKEFFWVTLKATDRLSPCLMGKMYEKMDGVAIMNTVAGGLDGPSLYYGVKDGRDFFLIRDAFGDCPSGCAYARFYLFVKSGNRYTLESNWLHNYTTETPQWLKEARNAVFAQRSEGCLEDVPVEILSNAPPFSN